MTKANSASPTDHDADSAFVGANRFVLAAPGGQAPAETATGCRTTPADTGVDDIDRALVEVLMRNPRLSSAALGRATGLTPTAAERRIRRLRRMGILRGLRAVVCAEGPADGPRAPQDVADMFLAVSAPDDPSADGTVPQGAIKTVYHTAGRWSSVLHVVADQHEHGQVLSALSQTTLTGAYQLARIRRTYVKIHCIPGLGGAGTRPR